ncbi:hypothetical protein [Engelhardtia mirabilis]|uniref:Uncharacterized protein n=1 Tax=Engelhardtia mirabilis TaxID=2528011 RepID=A0A518BI37_9BACT|nr:hypothetical protein Pla133_17250 [Planctomycetes bacterium Pla133]QDV00975.1 hypothetical protein Pla86_17240 [Planctomycetes bacterium Pla86]
MIRRRRPIASIPLALLLCCACAATPPTDSAGAAFDRATSYAFTGADGELHPVPLDGDETLFEAWAGAVGQGWIERSTTRLVLVRGEGEDALVIAVDVAPMLAGDTTLNVLVAAGDRIGPDR